MRLHVSQQKLGAYPVATIHVHYILERFCLVEDQHSQYRNYSCALRFGTILLRSFCISFVSLCSYSQVNDVCIGVDDTTFHVSYQKFSTYPVSTIHVRYALERFCLVEGQHLQCSNHLCELCFGTIVLRSFCVNFDSLHFFAEDV